MTSLTEARRLTRVAVRKDGMTFENLARRAILSLLLLLFASLALAQSGSGILRGQVTDPSGAIITNADIVMTPVTGSPLSTQTSSQGMYEFKNLPAGKYTLNVVAHGFALYENNNVVIADQPLRLNVPMTIEVQEQHVQVSDTAPTIDVNPSSNAGAIVISGKELEALPDDPDELQSDLEALAGPSAGPNGGQMYIDGFTAGQLPPKSSIREIRINQNPFSSEYDKLGYGRIEIFTKPGTDKYHGQAFISGNDSSFNSSNPFAGITPGYYSTQYSGNIGGPLGKNASFFLNVERRNINNITAVNAQTLDPSTLLPTSTIEAIANPHGRTNISPRLDYALTKNNTLTARYQYFRDTEDNDGIGQFTLPSQGYNSESSEHTFQLGDTQVIGSKVVNETRFQYLRESDSQFAQNTTPAVNVLGAFDAGGNGRGTIIDRQDHYELQNYSSLIHGNHMFKFGGRLRAARDAESTTSGFNGTFIFSSLADFQAAECGIATSPPPVCSTLPTGATPQQLSVTTPATPGASSAEVTYYDAGLYLQDDWRVRSNITISAGLRFETQNGIHDHGDWAPRIGIAWGIGGRSSPPKLVLRGGFGIFYDRFQTEQLLQAELLNGVTQQKFVINNPTCYAGLGQPFVLSTCGASTATTTSAVYQVSPRLRAPYTLQSAISAERQLTKSATLAVTYLNSRGFDQLLTLSLNPTTQGGNRTYQYVSEGNFFQNQLIVNSNIRVGTKLQLFGYYTLNYANSDAAGASGFPSNSYNINQDYGRASFDTRHRLFLGGTIGLPYLFRLSPFMVASSGSPFNITSPIDLNGDSVFNDRPILTPGAPCPTPGSGTSSVYCTSLGTFTAALPSAGQTVIPINYAIGPSHFVLNLRLTKTFGFGAKAKGTGGNQGPGGPGGGGPHGGGHRGPLFGGGPTGMSSNSDRRYNLMLGVNVRNVFNKVNTANPSGILGSSYFGIPNALQGGPFSSSSAPRRIELQATFSF
ncbi:MAG: TonB-dependent receptor [Acidobacteriia bacterium]|nr:TonB-dependent receptor [Terriglobia bacterium]